MFRILTLLLVCGSAVAEDTPSITVYLTHGEQTKAVSVRYPIDSYFAYIAGPGGKKVTGVKAVYHGRNGSFTRKEVLVVPYTAVAQIKPVNGALTCQAWYRADGAENAEVESTAQVWATDSQRGIAILQLGHRTDIEHAELLTDGDSDVETAFKEAGIKTSVRDVRRLVEAAMNAANRR